MRVYDNKLPIIYELENLLNRGEKLIICVSLKKEIIILLREKLQHKSITNVKIWCCEKNVSKCEMINFISQYEMDEVLKLYYTYDFSDKILVISNSEQYGGMVNYVKNGILTTEEMVEAFLCKI